MPEKGQGRKAPKRKAREKKGGVCIMLQLVGSSWCVERWYVVCCSWQLGSRIPYGSTCFHEISYSSTQFHLLRSCDINAITTSNDPQPRHLTG